MSSGLLWLSFVSVLACNQLPSISAVIGGTETHVASFPYQVSVRRKSCSTCPFEQFATGAILSKDLILTTASAIRMDTARSLMVVAATSYRTAAEGMLFPVASIAAHEKFNALTLDYDVALLKLKVDLPIVDSKAVKVVKIADKLPAAGSTGVIAGWGKTAENGDYSEVLRSVQVPLISRESCRQLYPFSEVTENMICAGLEQGGSDACKGDGGSPLVVANEIVGLASWGVGCGRVKSPGVYTNLVELNEWISTTAANL